MAIPSAPREGGITGDKILFVVTDDGGGALEPRLLRGYRKATLDGESVADLGVYPTSGGLAHGNRNAVNTSQIALSGSSVPCQGVIVKAREANANDVWVGKTGLTADTTEATGGYRLTPGASVGVPCRNANEVYLRWAAYTAGDGVEWLGSAD